VERDITIQEYERIEQDAKEGGGAAVAKLMRLALDPRNFLARRACQTLRKMGVSACGCGCSKGRGKDTLAVWG
jgi:hypothetical protein